MWIRLFLIGLALVANLISRRAPAPTPPESYTLKPAKLEPSAFDKDLDDWLVRYADNKALVDLSVKDFAKAVKQRDNVTQTLMRLRYVNNHRRQSDKFLTEAVELAKSLDDADEQVKTHPLTPYLLEEILRTPKVSKENAALARELLEKYGSTSCPTRDVLLRKLDGSQPMSVDQAKAFLDRLKQFNSRVFHEEAIEDLLQVLKPEEHGDLAPDLHPYLKQFPKVAEDNRWIIEKVEGVKEDYRKSEPYLSYSEASEETRNHRCNTANTAMAKALKQSNKDDKQHLKEAEAAAMKLASCFRRKGNDARMRYWRSAEQSLGEAFGFAGEEIALRRRGLVYWGQDDFKNARAIFEKILAESKKDELKEIEARALYTFGRIAENQGELQEALGYYDEYVNNHPKDDEERREQSLMSLVLLHALVGKQKEALSYANRLVDEETVKPIDARSTTSLSFGLYWGGKLYYEMGDQARAEEYWRRAASEFYSTFYGAIGHFALEKMVGQPLALQPSRSKPFNFNDFYKSYNDNEQKNIDRIMALLDLGMREAASCEITDLPESEETQEKAFVKSLFLFAAGDWLESIKVYGNLPRSFRNSLPAGSERLLFPKAYTEEVLKYANRLEIDADYIFAIIRQESVFNPRARSPVGAQGLMQLMPQTARMEARQLRRGYVSPAHRQDIISSTKSRRIYDAETNLALGVHHVNRLLNRYKNSVLVLTAYNASPKATERWQKSIPTEDVLSFIERIPYRETRAYVKLVMRNYFYYKRWYSSPDQKLVHLEALTKNVVKAEAKPQTNVKFSL